MLHEALKYYGQKEITGPESNTVILEMIQEMYSKAKDDSRIAWCSIFMNAVAKRAGYPQSDSMAARSWLKVGEPTDYPAVGDVVVFWRYKPNSWQGHVGLYIREDANYVWCLGGNQSDAVNIRKYLKNKVLGYRKLKKLRF